jgi:heme exporter protein A
MISERLRLTASGLVCIRGGRLVFDGLDFTLGRGEALLLRGPNGSGKSSLLRQIAGLVELAGGTLALEGGDNQRSLPEQAHYVGHQDALKAAFTAEGMLSFWADFFGSSEAEPARVLEDWGLSAQALLPVAYLSAGQRRRLALTRLSFGGRPLWLLDEPSVGLDAASLELLRQKMETHLAQGGLLIAATHLDLGLTHAHSLQMGQQP